MSKLVKQNFKEIFGIIAFAIINIAIAYTCTTALGIKDVVLFQSYTAMQYTITYEIIIFFALSLFESLIYHYKFER